MIYVNEFKVGDTVVLRNGTTGTVEEISKYEKGFGLESFGLELSCFPGKVLGCYADGWQKNFEQGEYDIVQHIPNQGEDKMKKVMALGHQPRHSLHGDKRPDPSVGSAAVKPTQSAAMEPTQDEMTMRDQFAMAAMSGMLAKGGKYACYEDMARWSYDFADEMLKVRGG